MCECINVDMGSYDNQSKIVAPKWSSREFICVDNCIKDEVLDLWERGIITNGCCCGHNIMFPYIGVDDESIGAMESLGYKKIDNPRLPGDRSHFFPMNAKYTPNEAWQAAITGFHKYYAEQLEFRNKKK